MLNKKIILALGSAVFFGSLFLLPAGDVQAVAFRMWEKKGVLGEVNDIGLYYPPDTRNVYAVGFAEKGAVDDGRLEIRRQSDGELVPSVGMPNGFFEKPNRIFTTVSVLSDGSAIVGGYVAASPGGWYLTGFNSAGTQVWERTGDGLPGNPPTSGQMNKLKVVNGTEIWAAGHRGGTGGPTWAVIKAAVSDGYVMETIYNTNGSPALPVLGSIYDIDEALPLGSGRGYAVGRVNSTPNSSWYVDAFSGLGFGASWSKILSPSSQGDGIAYAVRAENGYLYVAGINDGVGRIEKRDWNNGNLITAFGKGGAAEGNTAVVFSAIAGDINNENLYVTTGGGVWQIMGDLEAYSKSDGHLVWTQPTIINEFTFSNIDMSVTQAVKIDNLRGLFIGGFFSGGAGGPSWYLQKSEPNAKTLKGDAIRAIHIRDLRLETDRLRGSVFLPPKWAWIGNVLNAGTPIRAAHINELRAALEETGCSTPQWGKNNRINIKPATGEAIVEAVKEEHFIQLSNFIDAGCVPKRVFVTSQRFTGNLVGVTGADGICNTNAVSPPASLGGTWRAWISDSTGNSPASRFTRAGAGYQRLDGVRVASSWSDLTDGSLLKPININQFGQISAEVGVWSATNTSGNYAGGSPSVSTCNNWTNTYDYGRIGNSDATNSSWTDIGGSIVPNCSISGVRRLYCFEQ